jgi:hypothetical protein
MVCAPVHLLERGIRKTIIVLYPKKGHSVIGHGIGGINIPAKMAQLAKSLLQE